MAALTIQTILYPPKKTSLQQKSSPMTRLKEVTAENFEDQQKLQSVLNSISVQSDELLLGESLWMKRSQQKRLSDNCLTPISRSHSVKTTFPSIAQAKNWSIEKEFWLTYIPRQQRIWEYAATGGSGQAWEYWGPVRQNPSEEDFLEDLLKDSKTGEKISFPQRCERYQRSLEWEQKVISEYDHRALGNYSPVIPPKKRSGGKYGKQKEAALTQTLTRYKNFRKAIMDNLNDVELDTKVIDEQVQGCGKRFQVEQMQRLTDGYSNLKWVYDLNPELVESLAQQHLSGPGGKKWMNLSRLEVKKVLSLLKKSQDPDFCLYSHLIPSSQGDQQSQIMPRPCQGRAMNLGKCTSDQGYKKVKKSGVKPLRPSQMMPLHVPGHESLKSNVLITPYTPDMDEEEGNHPGKFDGGNIVNATTTANANNLTPTIKHETGALEEEGLTIESFAPFYRS